MPHTIKGKKQLLTRVRRIKGQADALEKALEQGTDCSAVLQQIAAIRGTVTRSGDNQPLAGVVVTMFSSANAYISGKAMQTGTDPIPTERA